MNDTFSSFWRSWFIAIVFFVAVFSLDSLHFFDTPKRWIEAILIPLEKTAGQTSRIAAQPFQAIRYYRNGVARIQDLESRLAEQSVDAVELETLRQENQELKKLLGTPLPPDWKFLSVPVIALTQDSLVIAAGKAHGLHEGLTVVYQDMFVGELGSVSAATSEVILPNYRQQTTAASIASGVEVGLIEGIGAQSILTKVEQDSPISGGEILITSGSDGLMPGLVIGTVKDKVSQASEGYQRFAFEPQINLDQVETVFVVIGVGSETL